MLRAVKGGFPSIDACAHVNESGHVIGDVAGPESSIWIDVVISSDVNGIRIGSRMDIQELVHVMRKRGRSC